MIQASQLEDSSDGFLRAPGAPTREHLQDYAAKRPDVDLRAVPLTLRLDDLRSHPEDRALHGVRDVVAVDVVCLFRNSKVGNLARPIEVEEDVVSFEIAVEDSLVVEIC